MISPCGIECDDCEIFIAANDAEFAEKLADSWRRSFQPKAKAEWFKCQGCHGDDSVVWGDDCKIRECCIKTHGLSNCSECNEFPCKLITAFENDGYAHHKTAVENLRQMRDETG